MGLFSAFRRTGKADANDAGVCVRAQSTFEAGAKPARESQEQQRNAPIAAARPELKNLGAAKSFSHALPRQAQVCEPASSLHSLCNSQLPAHLCCACHWAPLTLCKLIHCGA